MSLSIELLNALNGMLENVLLKRGSETGPEADTLLALLAKYRVLVANEVAGAKNQRNLAIHNTTRLIYESQIELIDELVDQHEDSDTFNTVCLSELISSLEEGEIVVA